jgi:hypothetical protein
MRFNNPLANRQPKPSARRFLGTLNAIELVERITLSSDRDNAPRVFGSLNAKEFVEDATKVFAWDPDTVIRYLDFHCRINCMGAHLDGRVGE